MLVLSVECDAVRAKQDRWNAKAIVEDIAVANALVYAQLGGSSESFVQKVGKVLYVLLLR